MSLDPAVTAGCLASLCTGVATGFGALPILGLGRPSASRELAFLAFAGGVMLAASLFSLILPGIAAARGEGHALPAAILLVLGATASGAGRWSCWGACCRCPRAADRRPASRRGTEDQLLAGRQSGMAGLGIDRQAIAQLRPVGLHGFARQSAGGVEIGVQRGEVLEIEYLAEGWPG